MRIVETVVGRKHNDDGTLFGSYHRGKRRDSRQYEVETESNDGAREAYYTTSLLSRYNPSGMLTDGYGTAMGTRNMSIRFPRGSTQRSTRLTNLVMTTRTPMSRWWEFCSG
jgi:hypothetical protein